jgi:hypothetical protein
MNNLYELVKPHFKKTQSLPNLEIELRFGKFNGKFFDTNVGEGIFTKVLNSLEKYSEWENVVKTRSTSYFLGQKRMDIDEESDEVKSFTKKRISKVDHIIPNQPLDVRFSTAQEIPIDDLNSEEVMDFMRYKERTSFIRKNLSIDMTVVTAQPDDSDDESDVFYEIELEIINPKLIDTDKKFFNLIYKVQCILNTL